MTQLILIISHLGKKTYSIESHRNEINSASHPITDSQNRQFLLGTKKLLTKMNTYSTFLNGN